MNIANDSFLDNTTPDLASDWVSKGVPFEHTINMTIQLVFTGSPIGSFVLECSSEPFELFRVGREPSIWTTYGESTQVITEAGNHTWHLNSAGFSWLRIRWTENGGTGELTNVIFNAKGA